jgi:hypothetical protein
LAARADVSKPRIDLAAAKTYLLSPPSTAFDFNFDGSGDPPGYDPPGWIDILDSWRLFGGFYQVFNNSIGYKLAVLPNCNESADITALGMRRDGADTDSKQGILFKMQITDDNKVSAYLASYDRAGHAQIERLDAFDVTTNTGTRMTLCSGTPTLSAGGYNTLLVSTRGPWHTFSINGQKICAARDATYGTGSAGILAYFGSAGAGNLLAVDEFILQPTETAPGAIAADELIVAAEPAR